MSAKTITRSIPPALFALAKKDLPIGQAHTYYDRYIVFQSCKVVDSEKTPPTAHVTSVLATGASVLSNQKPPELPTLSYESACALFEHETKASIIATRVR